MCSSYIFYMANNFCLAIYYLNVGTINVQNIQQTLFIDCYSSNNLVYILFKSLTDDHPPESIKQSSA